MLGGVGFRNSQRVRNQAKKNCGWCGLTDDWDIDVFGRAADGPPISYFQTKITATLTKLANKYNATRRCLYLNFS